MENTRLHPEQYDTDKLSLGYLEKYDAVLQPWVDTSVALLELGARKGGSLLLWRDYFPSGTIVGIDIKLPKDFPPTDRIRMYEGSQADPAFLSRVANEVAPEGFDIIIDDASHMGDLTKIGFWHLFENHLKPGGLYVIEDWGTGYWDDWPDGRSLDLDAYLAHGRPGFMRSSVWNGLATKLRMKTPMQGHNYGMVGFIKQLVDEQGAHDATRAQQSGRAKRKSRFASVLITASIVFVRKAAQ
jgi:hypothetical protein